MKLPVRPSICLRGAARSGDSTHVVVDGIRGPGWEAVGQIAFDVENGTTNPLAYVARYGDSVAVVDDRGRHSFDIVITGSLQFLRDGSRWVCLVGDSKRRRLRVVVEGIAVGRPVDWAEMARLIGRDPSEETLRAWVAADGELIAAGGE